VNSDDIVEIEAFERVEHFGRADMFD
jgi:hypothetical protein